MVEVAMSINEDYLKKHADEIINTTVPLAPSWIRKYKYDDDPELQRIAHEFEKKQMENGNHYYFGPMHDGMIDYDQVDVDFCKATGHWGLFEWVEMGD